RPHAVRAELAALDGWFRVHEPPGVAPASREPTRRRVIAARSSSGTIFGVHWPWFAGGPTAVRRHGFSSSRSRIADYARRRIALFVGSVSMCHSRSSVLTSPTTLHFSSDTPCTFRSSRWESASSTRQVSTTARCARGSRDDPRLGCGHILYETPEARGVCGARGWGK